MFGKNARIVITVTSIIGLMSLTYCIKDTSHEDSMINKAFDSEKIVSLFCLTPDDISHNVEIYLADAHKKLDAIINLPAQERTYDNTARPLDELFVLSDLAIAQRIYEALELVSPDKEVREAAHNAYIKIQQFWINQIFQG